MQAYKISLFTGNKLNSIKKISKALVNSDIIHEEFWIVIKEEQNYHKLKEILAQKIVKWVRLKEAN